jgi:phosphoribosylamine--glycine ligase
MNVLIVGGGGREHALVWKLRQSPRVTDLFVAPGNAGTAELATDLPVRATDLDGIVAAAREYRAGLVVVGPEDPLAAGLADRLREDGFAVYGPSAAAARIESSKSWAKALMRRHGIPCGAGETFTEAADALAYIARRGPPLVVKADGLAAGKGVVIAEDRDTAAAAVRSILVDRAFGAAGETLLIEEYLAGTEISAHAITDGTTVLAMPFAKDHKRAYDGDAGPNTGGMGVFSPVPDGTPDLATAVQEQITQPLVRALAEAGAPFAGTIYPGLMLTPGGPKVLEVNCRFGDPETEVLLPRLESDLFQVLYSAATGDLAAVSPAWSEQTAVGVVLASGGYPGEYRTGFEMAGLEAAAEEALVFHAGTRLEGGRVLTAGGRVLTIVGIGATLGAAREQAYRAARRVSFEGMHFRTDIAAGL